MQLEVGMVLEGKVSGIIKYGAFVDLPDGKTGMVHISEISSDYVEVISDYVKIGQMVKVKLIGVNEEGKISLSMKQLEPPRSQFRRKPNDKFQKRDGKPYSNRRNDHRGFDKGNNSGRGFDRRSGNRDYGNRNSNNNHYDGKSNPPSFINESSSRGSNMSFEDMLSKFKQSSDERMSDLKRVTEVKRGGNSRRNSGQR